MCLISPTPQLTQEQPDRVVVAALVSSVHGPATAREEEGRVPHLAPVHSHVDERASQGRRARGGGAARISYLLSSCFLEPRLAPSFSMGSTRNKMLKF